MPSTVQTWDRSVTQGSKGFTKYATEYLMQRNVDRFPLECPERSAAIKLFSHQKIVQTMFHPDTTVTRLLVSHRTGSGKTLTMISVLNNFYSDNRPKVLIFPTEGLVNNFYNELFIMKNRYAEFVHKRRREDNLAPLKPGSNLTIQQLKYVKNLLAMTSELSSAGLSGHLHAPVRAMRYTIAGGGQAFSKSRNPIFNIQYDGKNPYSNKIVIMDEAHNLVVKKHRYIKQIKRLSESIRTCKNTHLLACTATPVTTDQTSASSILKVIKGVENKHATNEGFVSYYNVFSSTVYPVVYPGNPDTVLPKVIPVTLQGDNEKAFTTKYKKLSTSRHFSAYKREMKLANYANTKQYYAQIPTKSMLAQEEKNPVSYATKLSAIADYCLDEKRQQKILIMIHHRTGQKVLGRILKNKIKRMKSPAFSQFISLRNATTKAAKQKLDEFNSDENKYGKKIRIAIINSELFSEGHSFKSVRHLILADVPETHSAYMQRVGRVLRSCAYQRQLPEKELRTVTIRMFVAKHRNLLTPDVIRLERLKKDTDLIAKQVNIIARASFDCKLNDRIEWLRLGKVLIL